MMQEPRTELRSVERLGSVFEVVCRLAVPVLEDQFCFVGVVSFAVDDCDHFRLDV